MPGMREFEAKSNAGPVNTGRWVLVSPQFRLSIRGILYRMRRTTLLMAAVLLMGCRSHDSLPSSGSNLNADDAGLCLVSRESGESADCYAVRCAEDFVRRNGYTIDPGSGPQKHDPLDMSADK